MKSPFDANMVDTYLGMRTYLSYLRLIFTYRSLYITKAVHTITLLAMFEIIGKTIARLF